MGKTNKILCTGVLIAFGLTTGLLPSGANAQSLSELQGARQVLQDKMAGIQGQLKENKDIQNATAAEINRLNGSIQVTETAILDLGNKVEAQLGVIAKKNEEIEVLQKAYDSRKAKFQERLAEIYKQGEISYLEVLLQAESFSDFVTRYEYMGMIASKDQDLLLELEESRKALEAERVKLEQEKAHLEGLKAQQMEVERALKTEKGQQEAFYADLEKDEATLRVLLAQQQAEEASLAGQIVQLQQAEEARRAQEAGLYGGPTSVPSYVAANGSVQWPVPGYHGISSPYGYRTSPIYGLSEFHLGTDIPAPTGTPVVAAMGGTVVASNSHWSYGNNVVIYHTDGTSSLYAHLAGFNCSPGQTVNAGDVIGYVGSTGASTGAHLHIEIHVNGSRVNPQAYIGG